ncbi:hypothetical protein M758_6G177000 [Ceratodon purpureus]|nr:hypothetical protein M758_6G177000 [Ceratodon purpureus]
MPPPPPTLPLQSTLLLPTPSPARSLPHLLPMPCPLPTPSPTFPAPLSSSLPHLPLPHSQVMELHPNCETFAPIAHDPSAKLGLWRGGVALMMGWAFNLSKVALLGALVGNGGLTKNTALAGWLAGWLDDGSGLV